MRYLILFIFIIISFNSIACNIYERDILVVTIKSGDSVFVEGQLVCVDSIPYIVQQFVSNPNNDWQYSRKKLKEIDGIGLVEVSKGLVSLFASRESTYKTFIQVQDKLGEGYRLARNDFSAKYYKKPYSELDYLQQKMVDAFVPIRISEAEPNFVMKNGKLVPYDSVYFLCWF